MPNQDEKWRYCRDGDRSKLNCTFHTEQNDNKQVRWGLEPLNKSGTMPTMVQVTRCYHWLASGLGKRRKMKIKSYFLAMLCQKCFLDIRDIKQVVECPHLELKKKKRGVLKSGVNEIT